MVFDTFIGLVSVLLLFVLVSILVFTSFTAYAITALILVYILIATVLITMGVEIVALLLLLVYAGAVMVLFLFCLFFIESRNTINKTQNFNFFLFLTVFLSLMFLFFPVIVLFTTDISNIVDLVSDISDPLVKKRVLKDIWIWVNLDKKATGFNSDIFRDVGSLMYLTFYLPTFMCFLILIVALILIVVMLSDSDSYWTVSRTLKKKLYSLYDAILVLAHIISASDLSSVPAFFAVPISMAIISMLFSSLFCMLVSNFNFIRFMIIIEALALFIVLMLAYFSHIWGNIDGIVFILFVLSIFAAESAIGLSLYACREGATDLKFVKKHE